MEVAAQVTRSAGGWWLFAVPMLAKQGRSSLFEESEGIHLSGFFIISIIAGLSAFLGLLFWAGPGGEAWALFRGRGIKAIPGPRGYPIVGSLMEMGGQAHRKLADLARTHDASDLMALSMGNTRLIVASSPSTAKEILTSISFSDRPIKQSAQQLMFGRAIGFAPQGEYWRKLRRIAANNLFAPKRIAAHEPARQAQVNEMLQNIKNETRQGSDGCVHVRRHLQHAALNNIMSSVFGRVYDFGSAPEAAKLQTMVREGFELLGAFNWADHLPILEPFDPQRIHARCAKLVPEVVKFVQQIINEHKSKRAEVFGNYAVLDFVDVLLSMQGEDRLSDPDIIAVLWEMIFRGTDSTAILTEWVLAEMVLNPAMQSRVRSEIELVAGPGNTLTDAHIHSMPYLQAVVKETLRLHPPGPLLSWARLSSEDACVAGHHVPAGTTAMVNMWAITHDPRVWEHPDKFFPDRFVANSGGSDFDVRGSDLRLAPFGAGRRVCPGRALGLSTVHLWVGRLLQEFQWIASDSHPVDLQEVLKLSSEMLHPLRACPRVFPGLSPQA